MAESDVPPLTPRSLTMIGGTLQWEEALDDVPCVSFGSVGIV
jgi:hypothetical protein